MTPVDEKAPGFDENAIVAAAQRGDQGALSALYEHYFPRVYRYAHAKLRNAEDAEDVTEEIFLRIIDNIDGFAFRGAPFGAWVFRIARNEVVSHVRHHRTRGPADPLPEELPDAGADHAAQIEFQSEVDTVREATGKLPDAQREVIELRFGAGLSVTETAQALKKSENNVKVLQHKAIARLRQLVRHD